MGGNNSGAGRAAVSRRLFHSLTVMLIMLGLIAPQFLFRVPLFSPRPPGPAYRLGAVITFVAIGLCDVLALISILSALVGNSARNGPFDGFRWGRRLVVVALLTTVVGLFFFR